MFSVKLLPYCYWPGQRAGLRYSSRGGEYAALSNSSSDEGIVRLIHALRQFIHSYDRAVLLELSFNAGDGDIKRLGIGILRYLDIQFVEG